MEQHSKFQNFADFLKLKFYNLLILKIGEFPEILKALLIFFFFNSQTFSLIIYNLNVYLSDFYLFTPICFISSFFLSVSVDAVFKRLIFLSLLIIRVNPNS